MLLTQELSNVGSLNNPFISLTQEGLILSYQDPILYTKTIDTLSELNLLNEFLKNETSLIIPHMKLYSVLMRLGVNRLGLDDSINSFYLNNNLDKAQCLAYESRHSVITHALPEEFMSIKQLGLGPRPNQLLAKIALQLPRVEVTETLSSASRVTFILDRSGSMGFDGRMNMLKPAVINTLERIKQANPDTIISIYFYDDRVDTILENQAASSITSVDYERISNISSRGGTRISTAIKPIVDNMRAQGLLDNAEQFKNLTMVWLTDGEDDSISTSDQLANLFMTYGCEAMPQLIAVGIGQYNQQLLNGVAEDVRFKANLMFHIANPSQTNELFHVISQNIGRTRRQVILAIDVNEETIYKDLGVMQAGQCKMLIIELPKSKEKITCRLILDSEIYQRVITLSSCIYATGNNLLIDYFVQLKTNIILATANNPQAAEDMKSLAYKSIPPLVRDKQLIELRQFFAPDKTNVHSFTEEYFWGGNASRNSLFHHADTCNFSQAMYSDAMQASYSDTSFFDLFRS